MTEHHGTPFAIPRAIITEAGLGELGDSDEVQLYVWGHVERSDGKFRPFAMTVIVPMDEALTAEIRGDDRALHDLFIAHTLGMRPCHGYTDFNPLAACDGSELDRIIAQLREHEIKSTVTPVDAPDPQEKYHTGPRRTSIADHARYGAYMKRDASGNWVPRDS